MGILKIWVGLLLIFMLLPGCSKFNASIPYGQIDTTNGNKIVAFQDFDTKLDGTTDRTMLIVVRVEGDDSGGKLAKMMNSIKEIFLGSKK